MTHARFHTLSHSLFLLAAAFLFLAPRSWLPSFYEPGLWGTVALLSPLLVWLPKKILHAPTEEKKGFLLKTQSFIACSLLINGAGEFGLFQLSRVGFEFDKFTHFLVPFLLSLAYSEGLRLWTNLSSREIWIRVAMTLFFAGLLWEFLEMLSDALFHTKEWGMYGENIPADTLADILFNSAGILFAFFIQKRQFLSLTRKKSLFRTT